MNKIVSCEAHKVRREVRPV